LDRNELRELCIATLKDAWFDADISKYDKRIVKHAIVASQEAGWVTPSLMNDLKNGLQQKGDISIAAEAADVLGPLGVKEALEPISQGFCRVCNNAPAQWEPDWDSAFGKFGEATALLGQSQVIPLFLNPPAFSDELGQLLSTLALLKMRAMAGDTTAFKECLGLFWTGKGHDDYKLLALEVFPEDDYGHEAVAFLEDCVNRRTNLICDALRIAAMRKITALRPAISRAFRTKGHGCWEVLILAGCAAQFGDEECREFLREVANGNVQETRYGVQGAGRRLEADLFMYFNDEWDIWLDRSDVIPPQVATFAAGELAKSDPEAGIRVLRNSIYDRRVRRSLVIELISQLEPERALQLLSELYEQRCWHPFTSGHPSRSALALIAERIGRTEVPAAMSVLVCLLQEAKDKYWDKRIACVPAGEIVRLLRHQT
jgi:hypothetical protein